MQTVATIRHGTWDRTPQQNTDKAQEQEIPLIAQKKIRGENFVTGMAKFGAGKNWHEFLNTMAKFGTILLCQISPFQILPFCHFALRYYHKQQPERFGTLPRGWVVPPSSCCNLAFADEAHSYGREENCSAVGAVARKPICPTPPPSPWPAMQGWGVWGGGALPAVPGGGGGRPQHLRLKMIPTSRGSF